MRVVYSEGDEPRIAFDGCQLVLTVSKYGASVRQTPVPHAEIAKALQERAWKEGRTTYFRDLTSGQEGWL